MTKYVFKDTPPLRSKIMKAIKGKDTKIELSLRKELYKRGYRYRVNYSKLPGKPDIVFVKQRVAVFCDSEFWHGRNWENKKTKIKANRSYWINKIERNIARDQDVMCTLKFSGWTVLRFWESEIIKNLKKVINSIEKRLKK